MSSDENIVKNGIQYFDHEGLILISESGKQFYLFVDDAGNVSTQEIV